MKEQLFDILDSSDKRMYIDMANDEQCQMYYWPDSNGFVTYDQINSNHWQVIDSGYYDDGQGIAK